MTGKKSPPQSHYNRIPQKNIHNYLALRSIFFGGFGYCFRLNHRQLELPLPLPAVKAPSPPTLYSVHPTAYTLLLIGDLSPLCFIDSDVEVE